MIDFLAAAVPSDDPWLFTFIVHEGLWLRLGAVFVLGVVLGRVLVNWFPRMDLPETVWTPDESSPQGYHQLRQIPLLGYFFAPAATQRQAQRRRAALAVELVTGLLFAGLVYCVIELGCQQTPEEGSGFYIHWRLLFQFVLLTLLVAATVVDLEVYLIPDAITLGGGSVGNCDGDSDRPCAIDPAVGRLESSGSWFSRAVHSSLDSKSPSLARTGVESYRFRGRRRINLDRTQRRFDCARAGSARLRRCDVDGHDRQFSRLAGSDFRVSAGAVVRTGSGINGADDYRADLRAVRPLSESRRCAGALYLERDLDARTDNIRRHSDLNDPGCCRIGRIGDSTGSDAIVLANPRKTRGFTFTEYAIGRSRINSPRRHGGHGDS